MQIKWTDILVSFNDLRQVNNSIHFFNAIMILFSINPRCTLFVCAIKDYFAFISMEFFHVSEPTLNDHIKQVRTHTIHNVFIF